VATRKADLVELAGGPGTLGVFESFEISSSIAQPSEAKFVIGDDRAWKNIEKDILPGAEYAVVVNKTLLFKDASRPTRCRGTPPA
jgi:hypothetical protein